MNQACSCVELRSRTSLRMLLPLLGRLPADLLSIA